MRQFISARRLRSARVVTAQWQRRAVFLLGGVTVGVAAVGLALSADWVQAEFHLLLEPISKSSEEDDETGELNEAKEVCG